MTPEKLARMANQIAKGLLGRRDVEAEVAAHLKSFWSPAMRRDLIDHAGDETLQLDPVVRAALNRLRAD